MSMLSGMKATDSGMEGLKIMGSWYTQKRESQYKPQKKTNCFLYPYKVKGKTWAIGLACPATRSFRTDRQL